MGARKGQERLVGTQKKLGCSSAQVQTENKSRLETDRKSCLQSSKWNKLVFFRNKGHLVQDNDGSSIGTHWDRLRDIWHLLQFQIEEKSVSTFPRLASCLRLPNMLSLGLILIVAIPMFFMELLKYSAALPSTFVIRSLASFGRSLKKLPILCSLWPRWMQPASTCHMILWLWTYVDQPNRRPGQVKFSGAWHFIFWASYSLTPSTLGPVSCTRVLIFTFPTPVFYTLLYGKLFSGTYLRFPFCLDPWRQDK